MSDSATNPYQSPTPLEALPMGDDPDGPLHVLRGKLSTTALGLKLIYWGITAFLFSWVLILPVYLVMDSSESSGSLAKIAQAVGFLLPVLSVGLINFGPFFCLTAPAGFGLRPYAIASVILLCTIWVLFLVTTLFGLGASFLLGIGVALSVPLSCTLFLFFLHRLTRVIGREDLTRRCRIVFALGAMVFVLILSRVVYPVGVQAFGTYQLISALLLLLGSLLLLVFYANLINATADAIRVPEKRGARWGIL